MTPWLPKQGLGQSDDAARRDALTSVLAGLAQLGYAGITEADLGKLAHPDTYEDELAVMAEVRAYFQVSYKVRSFPLLRVYSGGSWLVTTL